MCRAFFNGKFNQPLVLFVISNKSLFNILSIYCTGLFLKKSGGPIGDYHNRSRWCPFSQRYAASETCLLIIF